MDGNEGCWHSCISSTTIPCRHDDKWMLCKYNKSVLLLILLLLSSSSHWWWRYGRASIALCTLLTIKGSNWLWLRKPQEYRYVLLMSPSSIYNHPLGWPINVGIVNGIGNGWNWLILRWFSGTVDNGNKYDINRFEGPLNVLGKRNMEISF